MNSKSLHSSLRFFELLTDRCFPHYYKTSHVCRFVPDNAKLGNVEEQFSVVAGLSPIVEEIFFSVVHFSDRMYIYLKYTVIIELWPHGSSFEHELGIKLQTILYN